MAELGKGRVCVTGGTGFIGSWIIKKLLEDGYSVNTTVRADPEKKRDVSFLTNLPGASEKLKIFNADLDDPESFNEAIEGCVGIFHTAASVDFEEKEAEEIVTKRSIDGALGILKAACKNSKTVKRVVYTSSASAVYCQDKEKEKDVMDESYWSDIDILRNHKPFGWAYSVSKTQAEKAVLEYGQQNGLDIVTVIPTIVVGPFICPKLPTSVYGVLPFLFGNNSPISRFHMVHVDDVARAHIFLLEHPNPKGRYNCSPFLATLQQILHIVSSNHPEFQIPKSKLLEGPNKGLELPHLTSKKLTDAGFEFKHTIEETFEDAIQTCKEKGFF
ncbi:hypothetical protein OROMI_009085 [Orobanche minor]